MSETSLSTNTLDLEQYTLLLALMAPWVITL